MSKQEEISDAAWAEAKRVGAAAADERPTVHRSLSKDDAGILATKKAAAAFPRNDEERQAFYTGFMEAVGY